MVEPVAGVARHPLTRTGIAVGAMRSFGLAADLDQMRMAIAVHVAHVNLRLLVFLFVLLFAIGRADFDGSSRERNRGRNGQDVADTLRQASDIPRRHGLLQCRASRNDARVRGCFRSSQT